MRCKTFKLILSPKGVFCNFQYYYVLGFFFVLSIVYLLGKSLFNQDPEIDLKYIWVAGELWADGLNPYSSDFARIGDNLVGGNTNRLDRWLYPPNWWWIARGLAIFDLETAVTLWRGLNAMMIFGGTWLAVRAFCLRSNESVIIPGVIAFFFVSTMQATAITLSMGQTSIIIYFGLCALLFGVAHRQNTWVIVGLVLVALKPQVGIIVFASLSSLKSYWRAIFYAILVTGIFCIPGALFSGIVPTFGGLISAYLDYDGALVVNSAAEKTGLRHLIDRILDVELSVIFVSLVSALMAWVVGIAICNHSRESVDNRLARDVVVWSIVCVIGIGSLHSYDFVIAAPLIMLCFQATYPVYIRVTVALCLCLIYRSGNLAKITGFQHPESFNMIGSQIDSLGAAGIFISFATYLSFRACPEKV